MKVHELVTFLQLQNQDADVVFCQYSDYTVLEARMIQSAYLCDARSDGWVQDARPDKELKPYLIFPGN